MTDNHESIRQANVALATSLMQRFNRDMDGWYDQLHDDIVMEMPFGASVGLPIRVEGKAASIGLFQAVITYIQVRFADIQISPMADPARIIAEYTGYGEPDDKTYRQKYICVQEYRDGKLILFREYWDALVVDRAFGDLSTLAG